MPSDAMIPWMPLPGQNVLGYNAKQEELNNRPSDNGGFKLVQQRLQN